RGWAHLFHRIRPELWRQEFGRFVRTLPEQQWIDLLIEPALGQLPALDADADQERVAGAAQRRRHGYAAEVGAALEGQQPVAHPGFVAGEAIALAQVGAGPGGGLRSEER